MDEVLAAAIRLYHKANTLESGINIAPWINIAPGKFGKKNKRSPIYTLYFKSTK